MICSKCKRYEADPGHKTCSRCRKYVQEYRKQKREQGLCEYCGKNPVKPGSTRCEECLTKSNTAHRKRRISCADKGICSRCRKNPVADGGRWCASCREEHLADENASIQFAKDHGLCTRCRIRPAVPGYMKCVDCLQSTYKSTKIYNESHREERRDLSRKSKAKRRKEAAEQGLCNICFRNPVTPGMKTCGACRSKKNERNRQQRENRFEPDAAFLFIRRSRMV